MVINDGDWWSALDWKKAFDSVHVDSLLDALRRFGLPQGFVHMIGAMMRSRHFFVTDCGETSALHSQMSGISQGCTLSLEFPKVAL